MSGFYMPNLDEVREPEPVPEGFYEVEIIDAKLALSEKGDRIQATIAILNPPEDAPRPPAIYHTLFLLREGIEEWKIENTLLQMKRFLTLFEISPPDQALSNEETAEWLAQEWRGKRARCKVNKTHNERVTPARWQNDLVVPALAKVDGETKASAGIRTV